MSRPHSSQRGHSHVIDTDNESESDDGGLMDLVKEDMLQYLHTVSNVIEEII